MGIGRFIQADECTVDKARLDFARLLVSTPNIEIVNKSLEFFIDGTKFDIKLVEEWGCLLGEDALLTEVESESMSEVLVQPNDVDGLDEVQGEWELDDLVNDLHKECVTPQFPVLKISLNKSHKIRVRLKRSVTFHLKNNLDNNLSFTKILN